MDKYWGGEIKLPTAGALCHGAMMEKSKTKVYEGRTIFGVPLLKTDRVTAINALQEYFMQESTYLDRVIDYNEKLVARCGVLLTFNSILLVLISYATLPWFTSLNWYKVILSITLITWAGSNTRLIFALRHVFPNPQEFTKEADFRLTADLYITRMAIYNITLLLSLLVFLIITIVALVRFMHILDPS